MTFSIMLNGQSKEVPQGTHLAELINSLGLGERRIAVEVNQEIVPRSQHGACQLKDGDQIEVVHAIGGG